MMVLIHVSRLSTGKIVGIAKWHFFLDLGPHCVYPKKFPPGGNAELGALFFRSLEEKRDAVLAGKKYALMAVLAIDPAYQRMGIGKKLLDWGLAKCDEEGWECWIDATKNGKGLYEKCGWELVEDKHFDLEKYGGAKGATDTCSCMLRQPQSQG
jgi:GNAT superfamily N-acetyltransferase